MWLVGVGFVFFLGMTLSPVGNAIASLILPDARPAFPVTRLAIAYVLAALIVLVAFRQTKFLERLPQRPPGRQFIVWGIVLFFAFPLAASLDAMYLNARFSSFLVQNSLTTFPAYICFMLGCGRFLLNAGTRGA